jgi:hypothetical protein
MRNMKWREAVEKVLRDAGAAMHYTEIAEAIISRGLRTDVGATPAATVSATIAIDMSNANSNFVRVGRGEYTLKDALLLVARHPRPKDEKEVQAPQPESLEEPAGIINAFGMYWRRDFVIWNSNPKILGQQQQGARTVNFSEQVGLYLLNDSREVVYVGRATDQRLGKRLYQHTLDRLNGRWDRFSWFGLLRVTDDGKLVGVDFASLSADTLTATMEALLIEGLEPSQNRKRGDDFRAVEYLQVRDPELNRKAQAALFEDLRAKLGL